MQFGFHPFELLAQAGSYQGFLMICSLWIPGCLIPFESLKSDYWMSTGLVQDCGLHMGGYHQSGFQSLVVAIQYAFFWSLDQHESHYFLLGSSHPQMQLFFHPGLGSSQHR